MSFKGRYLNAKASLKRRISQGSANISSTLSSEPPTRSPSPTPHKISHPENSRPENLAPVAVGHSPLQATTSGKTSTTPVAAPSPVITVSAPYAIRGDTGPTVSPVPPHLSDQVTPQVTGTTFECSKTTAWSGLKTLLGVLGSSTDVFPPLSSAIHGLDACIDVFESASKGRKDYDELYQRLNLLLGDLYNYFGNTLGPAMTTSMKNLCIGLDEEVKFLREKHVRGAIQRYAEALDDSEAIVDCYRRIQGHIERLVVNANISTWETVNELTTEGRLQKLSPTLAAVYNSAESEDVQRRACTPGTRERELMELLNWVDNKAADTSRVYWMNGMAGTGKTTIAYSLCAQLAKSAQLGASFFCSQLIPECRNVKLIIPSIAYQLARFSYPFRFALSSILEADPDVHTRVLKVQFEKLLVESLTKVKHTLPTDFVVVIDALDECENEDSIGQILDVLLSSTASCRLPVRFLLSSRPESEIYTRMMSRGEIDLGARLVLHDLDAHAVNRDIMVYLQAELGSIGITPPQIEALAKLSGVLFIFASTAARYIKGGVRYMEHEDRLNAIIGLSPVSTGNKDKEIDKLYTSILQAVFENENIGKPIQDRLKTLLDTVICVQEPTTVDALAGLVGEKGGKHVEALLRPLSSVLNIAEPTGVVTTLHASFSDYMLDYGRSFSFHCNPPTTHARISHSCFRAINNVSPQFNICQLKSSYMRDDDIPYLAEISYATVLPHQFYACRYWIPHLELGGNDDISKELLWDFLSTRLLLWMEVLNLKKCIYLGPEILRRAEDWSESNQCPGETTELAHDAWRFVTMFASHAVSQSTPHIYVSLLPLWPQFAPVHVHYFRRMQGSIQTIGPAIERRHLALLSTWLFDEPVECVCFSPDGSFLGFGTSQSVYVVDGVTGRVVLGPLASTSTITSVAFSPNGTLLASGSGDGSIWIWSTENGKLVNESLEGHELDVLSVCFFPDGSRLASSGDDGKIKVWDVRNGNAFVTSIDADIGWVSSICVSPDGTRIASGYQDPKVRVWDTESGDLALDPLEGHTGAVRSVCFSPDGTRIASGSDDKTIRIWDVAYGNTLTHTFQGHTDGIYSLAFSPDGGQIISGSRDHTLRLWDANNTLCPTQIFREHTESLTSVAFSPDGRRIVSSSFDCTICIWDAQSRGQVKVEDPQNGHKSGVVSVTFSNDGGHLISSSDDQTIALWDSYNGRSLNGFLQGHTNWVYSSSFSPDGTQIVSCSEDQTIRLWDSQTGIPIGEPLVGHSEGVLSTCFSPDGAILASGAKDLTIKLWDVQSREPIGSPLQAHSGPVRCLSFTPDGSRLVSGSSDFSILVWDVMGRKPLLPALLGHTDAVRAICVSPDGTRIVSGSSDASVRLWDINSGQAIFESLMGHTGRVYSVSFSPDSMYVVSGSEDKTIRLWNSQTGKAFSVPLTGHTQPVRGCDFSPEGDRIVSGSEDRVIRVWSVANLVRDQESGDSQDNEESPIISPGPYDWDIRDDGWVADSQSRLLVWVPPDLRPALLHPRNTLLISTRGYFRINLESAKIGESWGECYKAA